MSLNAKLSLGTFLIALIALAAFAHSQLAQVAAGSRASAVFSQGVEPLTGLQAAQGRALALENGLLNTVDSNASLGARDRDVFLQELNAILGRLGEAAATLSADVPSARAVDDLRFTVSRLRATQGEASIRLLRRELAAINAGFEDTGALLRADIAALRNSSGDSLMQASMAQAQGLGLLLAGLVVFAFFVSRSVSRPLGMASSAVRDLAENIESPVRVSLKGHFAEIVASLSSLQTRLAEGKRQTERAHAAQEARLGEDLVRERLRFEATLENIPHGCCLLDADRSLMAANTAFLRMYPNLKPGTQARLLQGEATIGPMLRPSAPDMCLFETANGNVIELRRREMPGGGIFLSMENVTEHHAATRRIEELSGRDGLTGLPNRENFFARLSDVLRASNMHEDVAVIILDVKGFRQINAVHGNMAGDLVLRAMAERLGRLLEPSDFLARTGADDFSIIQIGGPQPGDCRRLEDAAMRALAAPVRIDGVDIAFRVSIGMVHLKARRSRISLDPYAVMQDAEIALDHARMGRSTGSCLFSETMRRELDLKRQLESDLRLALAANQFELMYQPFVDVTRGCVSGFEALLRWNHPIQGTISPSVFVPVAEETGLIVEIGAWVLDTACREAARWPTALTLSVNLSPIQFRSNTLLLDVADVLKTSGLDPARLQLEVTESVFLDEIEGTLDKLSALRRLGVTLSMDDFGTGYSSLGYLSRFPFDKIKIDQSFVRAMHKPENKAIVRAVIGLSASMHMSVIAEGVETREQFAELHAEGCTEMQGYLFARPTSRFELPKLMTRIASQFETGALVRVPQGERAAARLHVVA